MMIGLSTAEFDVLGALRLNASPQSDIDIYQRRVSRTATLDGNTALVDLGYAPADSTMTIKLQDIGTAAIENLQYIVKYHSLINIATRAGVFQGAVSILKTDRLPVEISFLISQKMSE